MVGSKKRYLNNFSILFCWTMLFVYFFFASPSCSFALDIANTPLFLTTDVYPNIVLMIDDSGSMDSEVLLPTNDGAHWWNTSDKSFVGRDKNNNLSNSGILNYNRDGNADSTWKKYVYLFPNGTDTGNRIYGDSGNDHYAVPPTSIYAYLRSSDYNGIYYDYRQTYLPWVSNGTATFVNADPKAAKSDPVRGTGTINLSTDISSDTSNWQFRFHPGMVIPKGTYYKDASWKTATVDIGVTSNASIPVSYYPATYYSKMKAGTYAVGSGASTVSGNCADPKPAHYLVFAGQPGTFSSSSAAALAPDGHCLQRHEIKAGNTFPSGRTYTEEMQNFANWFTYYRKRHLALRAGAGRAFSDVKNVRTGGFRINNLNIQGMWNVNTHQSSLYDFIYSAVGSGGTPNREALHYAGGQFNTNTSIITHSCQQNFALLFTDGFANVWTGSGVGNCDKNEGPPYADAYSNTMADIAMRYYNTPLRSTLNKGNVPVPSACGRANPPAWLDCNSDLHMVTFGITLGAQGNIFGQTHFSVLDAYLNPPYWQEPSLTRHPVQVDDLYHAAVNSRGEMFNSNNPMELEAALKNALNNILERRESTAAAIATNSTRLVDNTLIYQAKFDSGDWSGQVVAYQINQDGSIGDVVWDTDESGNVPHHSSRNIQAINQKTISPGGVEFQWANLSAGQQSLLGSEKVLNWLRGDQSHEDGVELRIRDRVLGDIVNSDPLVVGVPNFKYENLPTGTPGVNDYQFYRYSIQSRKKMLYIGGNDGMLHAFDALDGVEKFAFIPQAVFQNLQSLSKPEYSHKYFVDGSPNVGDAYLDGSWKTILVSGLGAGGRSVLALDVTNPDAFDGEKVLWEFTDPDLGYTFGQPSVVRMKNNKWAVVFGNGYGSDNHKAFLFIVDLETGALIRKIETNGGTSSNPNGLSTPALIADSNRVIVTAYAGDLLGNIWKFDLSATDSSSWKIGFSDNKGSYPLFTAVNAVGKAQPITAPLEIGLHPTSGYMVFFGTGKYFEVSDTNISSPVVQSLYGIWDNGNRITKTDRSDLVKQEITYEGQLLTGNSDFLRIVSKNDVTYSNGNNTKRGWYLDLLPPSKVPQGERVVSVPLLRHGRVIFTTLIPSSDPCEYGGTSWIMELSATTGGRLDYSVFDLDKDGNINEADFVTVTIGGQAVSVPVSGLKSNVGIIKTPAVISAGEVEYKFSGGSDGNITVIREKGSDSGVFGRRSWRQLR